MSNSSSPTDLEDPSNTSLPHEPTLTERLLDATATLFEVTDSDSEGPSRLDRFAYRVFADRFREHEDKYGEYRQTINSARIDKTYDQYLAKTTLLTIIFGTIGGFLGLVIGGFLSYFNVFGAIESDVALPSVLASILTTQAKNIIGAAGFTIIGALLLGGGTAAALYFSPYNKALARSREIENLLPQTVTYMYALSQGGMLLVDIIERLADEKNTYGEIAAEFQAIQNSMEFFGTDLKTALREAREATPNDEFAELLDDLISIIDSGGNPTPFLEDKTAEYHRKSKRNEESFLETLDMVAQVYVTVGVVGVLLGLTIFIIMASIGGSGSLPVYGTIYIGIPTLAALFLLILDSITVNSVGQAKKLPDPSNPPTASDVKQRIKGATTPATDSLAPTGGPEPTNASARKTYSRTNGHLDTPNESERQLLSQVHNALRRERVLRTLGAPLRLMRKKPLVSVAATLPLAILYMALASITGTVTYTSDELLAAPVWVTSIGFIIPLLGILTPISYFHERNYRYQKKVNSELANVLKKLSSASGTGAKLSDNISLVATSSTGILAEELNRVQNELEWNVSMNNALTRFANRVQNPRLTRVVKLLIESNTASGQVRDVLSVAAEDAQTAKELDEKRFASMATNMVIIVFGYVIFLVVCVILITQLFPPLAEAASVEPGTGAGQGAGSVGGGWDFNMDEYRMLFYHGVLMQALASGLIAGKFGYGKALSGLKFTIIGLLIAMGTFFLI
jgi:flagellar protein FlaJ